MRFSRFLLLSLMVATLINPLVLAVDPPVGYDAFQYRNIGPTRGGRVTTVEGVVSRPGTFYMGATGGGVWKTTDYGITWKNISDRFFESPSIGAIRVVQSQPDIVYVGTGTDGIRSNVIVGKGMYKSTDAGGTWKHIGLREAGQIGAVEIHPLDPDIVYVAAIGQPFQPNDQRGVFRTRDGGKTWEKILFLADTIGAVDLEFAPDNPEIIYAAMWRVERKPWTIISGGYQAGGIYKSVDGGDHWEKLNGGLPTGLIGKSDLAVSPADPSRLYVLMEAPEGEGGLYRSDDYGATFRLVSTREEIINRPFYYCNITADPMNADVVYSLANRFMKSMDGGKTWQTLRPPHGDNHDMWINPENPKEFIESNDGGATITTNGGKSWSTLFNQPTAELYQVEVDDQYPYWLYAGQQDNTTIAVPSLPPWPAPAGPAAYWLNVGGCETGPAVPKPGDPDIVYANCKGRFGVYNKRTGQEQQYYIGATNIYGHDPDDLKYRFQRVAPIHVSPHNPDVVYMGSQYLHRTLDGGVHWERISPDLTARDPEKQVVSGSPITRDITGEEYYSTIYSIRESTVEPGIIWVGANDGPVHVTRDNGLTWSDVTPGMLPAGGRVDCVEPSHFNAGTVYIAVLRYQLGDWRPWILKSEDYGQSWKLLSDGTNGIPIDEPVRVVREDPQKAGLLFAGTESGIYLSMDDGKSWSPFRQNLPVTPVTDIKIHRNNLVLSTMGRGFWILDDIAPLRTFSEVVKENKTHLFSPVTATLFRYRRSRSGNVPDYPAPGMYIYYFLPDGLQGVKLSILDNAGNEVFVTQNTSSAESRRADPEREMQVGYGNQRFSGQPDNTPGLHRYRWNFHYRGPYDPVNRRFSTGPVAVPGMYKIRLEVGGAHQEAELVLKQDPRTAREGVTQEMLVKQRDLSIEVLELKARVLNLQVKIDAALKKYGQSRSSRKIKTYDQLKQLKSRVITAPGPYPTPELLDQLSYLYGMLSRADQVPGQDAYERYQELKKTYENLEMEYGKLRIK